MLGILIFVENQGQNLITCAKSVIKCPMGEIQSSHFKTAYLKLFVLNLRTFGITL